jgi:hypothetical protein
MDAFDDPPLFHIETGHYLDGLHLMNLLSILSLLRKRIPLLGGDHR